MITAVSLLVLLPLLARGAGEPPHSFRIADGSFLLDGKPFQIVSGEMHYARIPREYWRDRLQMARAMGLNTICTYVFWNYHEPEKGKYTFTGNADVATFVRTAQEEGLWVVVRPSPYACAEWEFGGYPWWLLNEKEMKVRSRDPRFLEMSTRYFNELGKQIAPLQITRGGNIIMVQLENEYGSYDKDKEYLALNRDIIRGAGIDVELYTCDGPSQMPNGYLPGLLPAVNGWDDVPQVKKLINTYHNGTGPYFIAEWYPAWFDTWGVEHHVVPAEGSVAKLDEVLREGVSINMYMVHGGTTRGFMNGANMSRTEPYAPQTSSYDYDAPINEAGNATPKYLAFRGVIEKYLPAGTSLPPVPPPKPTVAIPPLKLEASADLFAHLPAPVRADRPRTFEALHQGYGYVLYRTMLKGPEKGRLEIDQLRDYALIFVNGRRVALLDRRLNQSSTELDLPAGAAAIDIFVENLGRINYGPYLNDNLHGITNRVLFNGKELKGWSMYRFPCAQASDLKFKSATHQYGPVVRRGTFTLPEAADTYLDMSDWGKGAAWVNGHSIGRYWYIGPQQTLYVPGPWLKQGKNEVTVLELLNETQDTLRTRETPILDQLAIPNVQIRGGYDTAKKACVLRLESGTPGAQIRYTTDGSEPTERSQLATGELLFTGAARVAARAFRKGLASETIARVQVDPSLSTGRPVTLTNRYSDRYPAGGPGALTDGLKGGTSIKDGFWQGFEGDDIEAVIDLGAVRPVSFIGSRFLQDTPMWVFFPRSVEYAVSSDGLSYAPAGRWEQPAAGKHEEASIVAFDRPLGGVQARYVRVRAKSIGVCPPWHAGAGGKAWTFCDEITIR